MKYFYILLENKMYLACDQYKKHAYHIDASQYKLHVHSSLGPYQHHNESRHVSNCFVNKMSHKISDAFMLSDILLRGDHDWLV